MTAMIMGIAILLLVLASLGFAIRVAVGVMAMVFKIGFALVLVGGLAVLVKMFLL
jgi:hypothetical protein